MIQKIEEAAREAGRIILSAHGTDLGIENKEGHANFVTMYDRKVQDFLTARLREILPGAKFLGEENGMDVFAPGDDEGWLFVIDPIDGTTNFIHNMHPFVTSIGLMKDGAPYAGVVYAPVTDQMFSAVRGQGAYENGSRDPFLEGTSCGQHSAVGKCWLLHECISDRAGADQGIPEQEPGGPHHGKCRVQSVYGGERKDRGVL